MSNAALLYIYHTLKMDIPPSLGYRTNVTFPKKLVSHPQIYQLAV
jgi:hypothetical protein